MIASFQCSRKRLRQRISLALAFCIAFAAISCSQEETDSSHPPQPVANDTSSQSTPAGSNDNTDIILSPAYIETKVAEAENGKLDYAFVAVVVQAAEKAFAKGAPMGSGNGWLLSARDKYQTALRLYEAGNADPMYIAVTAIHLGGVEMYLGNLVSAADLEVRGTGMLESAGPASLPREIKTEYIMGLGWLARILRQQNKQQEARGVFSKATRFARDNFGEDSAEFKTLQQVAALFE